MQEKIGTLKLSKEAKSKATSELKKLKTMQPMSAEATVVRNYLDVLLGLPWGKKSRLKKDIAKAQKILDDTDSRAAHRARRQKRPLATTAARARTLLTSESRSVILLREPQPVDCRSASSHRPSSPLVGGYSAAQAAAPAP